MHDTSPYRDMKCKEAPEPSTQKRPLCPCLFQKPSVLVSAEDFSKTLQNMVWTLLPACQGGKAEPIIRAPDVFVPSRGDVAWAGVGSRILRKIHSALTSGSKVQK